MKEKQKSYPLVQKFIFVSAPIWAIRLVSLLAFAFAIKALNEPDLWWMLRTGEFILKHGVPYTDPFSFLQYGKPWINVKWGFEVLAFLWSLVFEPAGLVLLQAFVNLGILYVLYRMYNQARVQSQRINIYVFSFVVLAMLLASEFRMTARPEMISHMMVLVFILLHTKAFTEGYQSIRWNVWIIVLQALWANLHEAFGVGMVITLTFVSSALIYQAIYRKHSSSLLLKYSGLSLLSLLAPAIHPYGVRMIWHPLEIYRQLGANKYTVELLDFREALFWDHRAYLMLSFLLVLIVGLVWAFSRYKFKAVQIIASVQAPAVPVLLAMFAFLAFSAHRNIPFFMMAATPMVAFILTDVSEFSIFQKPLLLKASRFLLFWVLLVSYVTLVSNQYYQRTSQKDVFGLRVDPIKNASGAADFILQNNIKGRAFTDYINSSYLLWALKPSFKTYLDLRDLDVFSAEQFDYYFKIINNSDEFMRFDSLYQFDYIVLGTGPHPLLQEFLNRDQTFEMVYVDPTEAVFVRNGSKFQKVLEQHAFLDGKRDLFHFKETTPAPRFNWLNYVLWPFYKNYHIKNLNIHKEAARYYHTILHYDMCIDRASKALQKSPQDKEMNLLIAQTYLSWSNYSYRPEDKQGKLGAALPYLQRVLKNDPNDLNALLGMVFYHLSLNYIDVALDYINLVLEQDPKNLYAIVYKIEAYKIKANGNPELKSQLLNTALTGLNEAIVNQPETQELLWKKAELLVALERCEEAEQLVAQSKGMLDGPNQIARYEQIIAPCFNLINPN